MAASRKTSQRADENRRPDQRQRADIADEAGAGGQPGQLGQVDEHKAQHHHPVEDPLDDDGRQRGRDGHLFVFFQHDRPQHLAGARREDIVAEVADGDDWEQLGGGDRL